MYIKTKDGKVNPSNSESIVPYVDKLPIPMTAKPINKYNSSYYHSDEDYYNIIMQEGYHKFHRDFPYTKMWMYNGVFPGPTIEARKDVPILVRWFNNLPNKHLFPVPHTLHGTLDAPDVRTVVHLHGADVADDSDGYPDAWYTRNYEKTGESFTGKVYKYTNHQYGATLWYHDNAIGITRLNVYAGLAGFYILRDNLEDRLDLPKGKYEIPLMIQDRTFNEDGSLFYPEAQIVDHQASLPVNFGNVATVNGKIWPYLNVEPHKYRFRILNGSNVRDYKLTLSNGASFTQIGTDSALLHHAQTIESFLLEPAERIDVIIDFSQYAGQEILLRDSTGDPVPLGNEGNIMKFKVCLPLSSHDSGEVSELLPYHGIDSSLASIERTIHLNQRGTMHLLNNRMWSDPSTEKPEVDTIEIWHLVNHFFTPHPIHVHLGHFEIIGRKIFTNDDFDENGDYKFDINSLVPPHKYERGLKDTVSVEPLTVTTIVMHLKRTGKYVYNCSIPEYHDNDMMRPLNVTDRFIPIS